MTKKPNLTWYLQRLPSRSRLDAEKWEENETNEKRSDFFFFFFINFLGKQTRKRYNEYRKPQSNPHSFNKRKKENNRLIQQEQTRETFFILISANDSTNLSNALSRKVDLESTISERWRDRDREPRPLNFTILVWFFFFCPIIFRLSRSSQLSLPDFPAR